MLTAHELALLFFAAKSAATIRLTDNQAWERAREIAQLAEQKINDGFIETNPAIDAARAIALAAERDEVRAKMLGDLRRERLEEMREGGHGRQNVADEIDAKIAKLESET